MKILSITAGAAGMYCGSCLRDNALAAELMAAGHDVQLVPIYTPTLTDEANVSQQRVFFGGISVYLQQYSAIFRHTPWIIDRLWDSRFALKLAARSSIAVDPDSLGELTISMLKGEDGLQRKELQKLIRWMQTQPEPDVVILPNSLLIALARPIKEALNRPVLCTLQGEDLFIEGLQERYRNLARDLIRANVEFVDAFLPVSEYYSGFMTEYLGIPESKMHIVPLGITFDGYSGARPASSNTSGTFVVGYLARVAPEKGLHVLCDAYKRLRQRDHSPVMRLEVAGYLAREHRAYLAGIEQQMKEWGYAGEFHYRGALDRHAKTEFLSGLDVLSVPATYDDAKGMFLLEAMAAGVPVVQPRRGAFTEIIGKTSGGLLVEPDDCDSLADGLMAIWESRQLAEELGRNGHHAVRRLYSAESMARRAIEVFKSVVNGAPDTAISQTT
jgi:glycosyltransferase involved in cell wall biosynthesis